VVAIIVLETPELGVDLWGGNINEKKVKGSYQRRFRRAKNAEPKSIKRGEGSQRAEERRCVLRLGDLQKAFGRVKIRF